MRRRRPETEEERILKVAETRSCGTCAACCVTMQIDAIGKPAGAACRELRPEDDPGAGRCSVYEDRPEDCRTWSCMWRRGGLEPHERPDRVGVVIDLEHDIPTDKAQILSALECVPGGLDRPAAKEMIDRLLRYGDVAIWRLPTDGRKHLPVVP